MAELAVGEYVALAEGIYLEGLAVIAAWTYGIFK